MNRLLTLLALAALTSCSPDEPPPTAVVPKKPALAPKPSVPAPPPPAPRPPEPAPAPEVKPAEPPAPLSEPPQPKPLEPTRPSRLPKVPRAEGLTGAIHLPSFTFRALAGGAHIQINGELVGSAPCLWTVTDGLQFDSKIPVTNWPPDGALKISSTSHPENGSADLWLDSSDTLRSRFPHLMPGEAILYVDGKLGGKSIRGGLRLLVEGFKYAVYTPLVDPEGEEASRYLRTIWFDRIRNE